MTFFYTLSTQRFEPFKAPNLFFPNTNYFPFFKTEFCFFYCKVGILFLTVISVNLKLQILKNLNT
jgi:hypothetical protein